MCAPDYTPPFLGPHNLQGLVSANLHQQENNAVFHAGKGAPLSFDMSSGENG